jgi:hypothetical protein
MVNSAADNPGYREKKEGEGVFIKMATKYPSACWGDQSGLARRAIK